MILKGHSIFLVACVLLVVQRGLAQGEAPSVEPGSLEQRETENDLDDGDFSFAQKVLVSLFPSGVKSTWLLKRYLRSEKFIYLKKKLGDLRAVDEIYKRALAITNGDVSQALFIATFATMEHRNVGVRIPLLHTPIHFPITTESREGFESRLVNLPSHFYADSPGNEAGDRDKLQHFFGSAFFAYSFRLRTLASFIGKFVEWGEEKFIVDGGSDPRDLRANQQGIEFGLSIGDRFDAKPSQYLQLELVLANSRTDW